MKQEGFPFQAAYSQARELYGLELNPDEFESLGLIAWDKIGNKNFRWYKYITDPVKNGEGNYVIDLPCNCDVIESVTADYEDYQKTTPTNLSGNNMNGWIEGYIESRKYNTGFGYASGKFVKYFRDGNTLILADQFQSVEILYKGVITDDTGLPLLNVKEIDAIAAYLVYATDFKNGRLTKDKATLELAMMEKQIWDKLCSHARTPMYFSQNQMDEVLNVANNWDRKRFGKSFKPLR